MEDVLGTNHWRNETLIQKMRQGLPCSVELSRKTSCGREVIVSAQLSLRQRKAGQPMEMLETSIDITAQRRAEQEANNWRLQCQNVLQAVPVSVWTIDFSEARTLALQQFKSGVADPLQWFKDQPARVRDLMRATVAIDVNDHTIKLYGPCAREDLLGSIERFWPEDADCEFVDWVVSTIAGNPSFTCETRQRRHDGQAFDALFTARFVPNWDNVDRLVVTIIDHSDFKRGEAAVRQSEAFYIDMFHGGPFSAWHLNATGSRIIFKNLRDQGVTDFRAHVARHPEVMTEIMEAITVVDVNETSIKLFGGTDRSDMIGRTITPFWFPDRLETLIGSLDASYNSQAIFTSLTQMRTLKGDAIDVLYTRASSSTLRNAGHLILAIVDMTDKVKAQNALAEMQANLAHSARVSSLGELTASIAHEVNQPLTAVAVNAETIIRWLANKTPDLDQLRGLAEDIIADARRASDVVAHIRTMASPQAGFHKPVLMSDLVRDTLTLLGPQLTQCGVMATRELQADIPMVLGDPVQLQQVIVNLVINAIHAMENKPGSRIVLRTWAEAGEVFTTVEDNGPGIRAENLDRLFSSFFTTKADGMGIGLTICRTIVQAHGGEILAENIAPNGARFTVRLPAIK